MNIREQVKQFRKYQKLTQRELAQDLGVNQKIISEIESGKKVSASKEKLQFMLDYMDINWGYQDIVSLQSEETNEGYEIISKKIAEAKTSKTKPKKALFIIYNILTKSIMLTTNDEAKSLEYIGRLVVEGDYSENIHYIKTEIEG